MSLPPFPFKCIVDVNYKKNNQYMEKINNWKKKIVLILGTVQQQQKLLPLINEL